MQTIHKKDAFSIYPIGHVNNDGENFGIQLNDEYKDGLLKVSEFSHIIIFSITDRTCESTMIKRQGFVAL